jgi:mannose-6-phosphate isomerase-like protein (cupin superfamily)
MQVFDLSEAALGRMAHVDPATASGKPAPPIAFDFNGLDCGVASFVGQPPWERHDGDELLHVLAGEGELTLLTDGGPQTRLIRRGDLVLVRAGCWHRNRAPAGVTMLHLTPQVGEHSWDEPGRS